MTKIKCIKYTVDKMEVNIIRARFSPLFLSTVWLGLSQNLVASTSSSADIQTQIKLVDDEQNIVTTTNKTAKMKLIMASIFSEHLVRSATKKKMNEEHVMIQQGRVARLTNRASLFT